MMASMLFMLVSRLSKLFRRVIITFIQYLVFFVSALVPVRKGSICFSMKPGLYNGNSKYLYEFLVRSEGEVFDIFWLSDRVLNTGVLPIEKKFKGRFFRRYSLLGAVKFLRS